MLIGFADSCSILSHRVFTNLQQESQKDPRATAKERQILEVEHGRGICKLLCLDSLQLMDTEKHLQLDSK